MTPLKFPDNWRLMVLGDCFALASGIPKPSDSTGGITSHADIPVYGGNGIMGFTAKPMFTEDQLIIGRVGEKCGCIHKAQGRHWVTDNALYTKEWKIDRDLGFFFYLLDYANLNAHRSKGGQPLISQKALYKIQLPIPPQSEQVLIASILSLWHHAIDLTEKLLADKQALRSVLMHQLLTGKRRLPGFGQPSAKGRLPADWAFPKTEKVFKNVSIKNRPGEVVLSVTQDEGVVPRGDLDRKINMNHENTHTYKLVEVGDFVISLRSFQGGLEYSRYRGLVSPAYHVIRPAIALSDDFFRHYFKSPDFIQRLAIATIGIRDGKQISYGDFSFMNIPVPHLEEQRAIANVIDTCDREIELLQARADALREQKKGLMQQLLTGKKRVTTCGT